VLELADQGAALGHLEGDRDGRSRNVAAGQVHEVGLWPVGHLAVRVVPERRRVRDEQKHVPAGREAWDEFLDNFSGVYRRECISRQQIARRLSRRGKGQGVEPQPCRTRSDDGRSPADPSVGQGRPGEKSGQLVYLARAAVLSEHADDARSTSRTDQSCQSRDRIATSQLRARDAIRALPSRRRLRRTGESRAGGGGPGDAPGNLASGRGGSETITAAKVDAEWKEAKARW